MQQKVLPILLAYFPLPKLLIMLTRHVRQARRAAVRSIYSLLHPIHEAERSAGSLTELEESLHEVFQLLRTPQRWQQPASLAPVLIAAASTCTQTSTNAQAQQQQVARCDALMRAVTAASTTTQPDTSADASCATPDHEQLAAALAKQQWDQALALLQCLDDAALQSAYQRVLLAMTAAKQERTYAEVCALIAKRGISLQPSDCKQMIARCVRMKQWGVALLVDKLMQHQHSLEQQDAVCISFSLAAAFELKQWRDVISIFERLQSHPEARVQTIHCNQALHAHSMLKQWSQAQALLSEMTETTAVAERPLADAISFSTAIHAAATAGQTHAALDIFNNMRNRSVVLLIASRFCFV